MSSSAPDGSTVFGGFAAAYAARRPGYPDAVFDALEGALEGRRDFLIELGAGSGQATKSFSSRFQRVVAVEPDRRMLDAMPKIENVTRVNAAAEDADIADDIADAVVAATAYHWMDQTRVAANAFRWLRPGGVFFPFMYDAMRIDGPAGDALKAEEALWAPYKDRRLIEAVDYVRVLRETGLFEEVRPFAHEFVATLQPAVAAGLLCTASFVNAFVKAKGVDIAAYQKTLTDLFTPFGEATVVRSPLGGALAIKRSD